MQLIWIRPDFWKQEARRQGTGWVSWNERNWFDSLIQFFDSIKYQTWELDHHLSLLLSFRSNLIDPHRKRLSASAIHDQFAARFVPDGWGSFHVYSAVAIVGWIGIILRSSHLRLAQVWWSDQARIHIIPVGCVLPRFEFWSGVHRLSALTKVTTGSIKRDARINPKTTAREAGSNRSMPDRIFMGILFKLTWWCFQLLPPIPPPSLHPTPPPSYSLSFPSIHHLILPNTNFSKTGAARCLWINEWTFIRSDFILLWLLFYFCFAVNCWYRCAASAPSRMRSSRFPCRRNPQSKRWISAR